MTGEWEEFDSSLQNACAAVGMRLDEPARRLMFAHWGLLIEANRKFNLTRITTPSDAAVKHYADSLMALAVPGPTDGLHVLDVGTGGGFPAVPLAIVRPQWTFTAIDGTGKKARFVREAAGKLGLCNIDAVHARTSDLARAGDRQWDLVLLRAVAQLGPGLKEVHQLVRPGGRVVFYKTPSIEMSELRRGQAAATQCGFVDANGLLISLPSGEETLSRRLIVYRRKGV